MLYDENKITLLCNGRRRFLGCDSKGTVDAVTESIFQSTHPMRGATASNPTMRLSLTFQSTHPMRGATLDLYEVADINAEFQSTHPMRGATHDK